MKFGKSLSHQIEETLPDWKDKFLKYKELKKKLKQVDPMRVEENKRRRLNDNVISNSSKREMEFLMMLEEELRKFNAFFVEKEEEYIIRLKELQERIVMVKQSNEETLKVKKEVVDFHGEMVLLENYSSLNYTGLAKILKKYDKRTGALIRIPFIRRVLQQPFFTTDLLYKLIKECETLIDRLLQDHSQDTIEITNDLDVVKCRENLYLRSIVSSLKVLKEIRSGSSTVNAFSLPPLQECWRKIIILEQEAK